MKYHELPTWAQKEVKETYKKWALQNVNESRKEGADVKDYTEEELDEYVMSILTDKDDFAIEYDDDGENPVVVF